MTHSLFSGLEDIFWLLILVMIITFSIIKMTIKIAWSQLMYQMMAAFAALVALYIIAAAFNKFVLEDSSTAHWNAHARFTQAAIQSKLREEEQRVHVIAPPKMGGAKLNIIYTVGDVPLARDPKMRHASSGSLVLGSQVHGSLAQHNVPVASNIASVALEPLPPSGVGGGSSTLLTNTVQLASPQTLNISKPSTIEDATKTGLGLVVNGTKGVTSTSVHVSHHTSPPPRTGASITLLPAMIEEERVESPSMLNDDCSVTSPSTTTSVVVSPNSESIATPSNNPSDSPEKTRLFP